MSINAGFGGSVLDAAPEPNFVAMEVNDASNGGMHARAALDRLFTYVSAARTRLNALTRGNRVGGRARGDSLHRLLSTCAPSRPVAQVSLTRRSDGGRRSTPPFGCCGMTRGSAAR